MGERQDRGWAVMTALAVVALLLGTLGAWHVGYQQGFLAGTQVAGKCPHCHKPLGEAQADDPPLIGD